MHEILRGAGAFYEALSIVKGISEQIEDEVDGVTTYRSYALKKAVEELQGFHADLNTSLDAMAEEIRASARAEWQARLENATEEDSNSLLEEHQCEMLLALAFAAKHHQKEPGGRAYHLAKELSVYRGADGDTPSDACVVLWQRYQAALKLVMD